MEASAPGNGQVCQTGALTHPHRLVSRRYLSQRDLREKSPFMDFMTFLMTGGIYSPKLVQSEFQALVHELMEQKNDHLLFM